MLTKSVDLSTDKSVSVVLTVLLDVLHMVSKSSFRVPRHHSEIRSSRFTQHPYHSLCHII